MRLYATLDGVELEVFSTDNSALLGALVDTINKNWGSNGAKSMGFESGGFTFYDENHNALISYRFDFDPWALLDRAP